MYPYNNVAILKMKTKKSANFEATNLVYKRLLLASLGEGNGNPLQCSCLENPSGWDGKESACNAGDLGLIPGMGRFSEEGNGYPLHYSCLENSMDRGA